jgi:hypothetical protein
MYHWIAILMTQSGRKAMHPKSRLFGDAIHGIAQCLDRHHRHRKNIMLTQSEYRDENHHVVDKHRHCLILPSSVSAAEMRRNTYARTTKESDGGRIGSTARERERERESARERE